MCGANFYASAAILVLRARAARKSNSQSGLPTAIRSVAAFCLSDAAASQKDGPVLPLASSVSAAVQLHRTGHSCAAQHFVNLNDGVRTFPTFASAAEFSRTGHSIASILVGIQPKLPFGPTQLGRYLLGKQRVGSAAPTLGRWKESSTDEAYEAFAAFSQAETL